MKLPVSIILFLFVAPLAKAEELFGFQFYESLKKASHIIRGKIIDDKGTIYINQVLRGKCRLQQIVLPHIPTVGIYGPPHSPTRNFEEWEVVVFLVRDSLDKTIFHPVPIIEKNNDEEDFTGFNQAVTIMWIKEETVWYAYQRENPGPLEFHERGPIEHYLSEIQISNNFLKKYRKAKRKRTCKKKMRCMEELFNHPRHSYDAYDLILQFDCPDEILSFLAHQIKKDTMSYRQASILADYLRLGKNNVSQHIESIYQIEFAFWKEFTKNAPERWWVTKGEHLPRYAYFKRLISGIIQYQIGDVEPKIKEVRLLFESLEDYNVASTHETISELMDYYLE